MVIQGMLGLGDNIYQRAFVREIEEPVHLMTPWPQIYSDLDNVLPVKRNTKLRTQAKNIRIVPNDTWVKNPLSSNWSHIKIFYSKRELLSGNVLTAMRGSFGFSPRVFDLPGVKPMQLHKPYAVIRPVTVRNEWKNTARNPLPEYILEASKELKKQGFCVVSIADLKYGEEWIEGEVPYADLMFHKGELNVVELMSLVKGAFVVVGGVGWIVPMTISANTNLITILGGQGLVNSPERITGSPMNLKKAYWIKPDNYCLCDNNLHNCNKFISNFGDKFRKALRNIN